MMKTSSILSFSVATLIFTSSAFAQSSPVFNLGTVQVKARSTAVGEVGNQQISSEVTSEQIKTYDKHDVADAVDMLSGVILSTNQRNEKLISVRGFDSRQVPLFIDGIPVYVPYDGYVDLGRFTTADLSRIQVAKGFSSVEYGPNTLGGAINLISKRPQKAFEGDLSLGYASGNDRRLSANVGTLQEKWYLQAGASVREADSFPMSKDFAATTNENGGERENSYRTDTKYSAKVAYTPNASDEYALSFYSQNGKKGQPPSANANNPRFWQWPYWNKQSLYYVSQTALRENEILKVRVYHDRFDNEINSFTDNTYSVPKLSGQGSVSTGKSIYNDQTSGGSLTLESFSFDQHQLTTVFHFKEDDHREKDGNGLENTKFRDQLNSLGIEDAITLSDRSTLQVGASHVMLTPKQVFSVGNDYQLPGTQSATEGQVGYFFKESDEARWFTTLAYKNRMPTLRDRYSQRLGTFIQNPDLGAEKALNFEVGQNRKLSSDTQIEAALFLNHLDGRIQTVENVQGNLSQMQNAGRAQIYGLELGADSNFASNFRISGNYTYMKTQNLDDTNIKLTDLPEHKLRVNAIYQVFQGFKLIPSAEWNSSRWTSNTLELDGYEVLNFKASYQWIDSSTLEAGVSNLTDRNYSLSDGFPNPGRMAFVNLNLEM